MEESKIKDIAHSSIYSIQKVEQISTLLFGVDAVKVIFEFGSRYGEDSVEFAKKYSNAIIYGFECNPETLPFCKEVTSKFLNIILTESAVSDKDSEISFYAIDKEKTVTTWQDGNQGASSIFKVSDKYPIETYVQKELKVKSVTLKTFMHLNGISEIDILWMDIQGAELSALIGLDNLINNVKLMHIEVEFFEIYDGQPLFEDVKNFLNKNQFEFMGFTNKSDYSGDAVFINNAYLNSINKLKIKEILIANDTYSIMFLKNTLKTLLNTINRILKKLEI